jgi:rhodanese-related sulfurtransferase
LRRFRLAAKLKETASMATKDPREPFTRISVQEAKDKIAEGAQIIDVRTPGEYAGGHVPGASNIPHMSVVSRKGELAADKELVFICQMGSRSALACEFAAAIGFKELYNVEGGTEAWIKAGYGVE